MKHLDTKPIKLYVIDDFKSYLELLLEYLTKTYPNITIKGISNSITALDIIIQNRPDILVVDHAMPYRDGTQLVELVYEYYHPYTVLLSSLSIHKKSFDYYVNKNNDFLFTMLALKSTIDTIIKNILMKQEQAIDTVVANKNINASPGNILFLKQVIRIAKQLINIEKATKKLGLYKAIQYTLKKNNKYIQYHLQTIRQDNIDIFPAMDNIDMVRELVHEVKKLEEMEKKK